MEAEKCQQDCTTGDKHQRKYVENSIRLSRSGELLFNETFVNSLIVVILFIFMNFVQLLQLKRNCLNFNLIFLCLHDSNASFQIYFQL